jgi:hypothetical protein
MPIILMQCEMLYVNNLFSSLQKSGKESISSHTAVEGAESHRCEVVFLWAEFCANFALFLR